MTHPRKKTNYVFDSYNIFQLSKGIPHRMTKRIFTQIIVTAILLLSLFTVAHAETQAPHDSKSILPEDLSTEALTVEQNVHLMNSFVFAERNRDSLMAPISCFDVSKDGKLACGFTSDGSNSILVFDKNMKLIYGFDFSFGKSFFIRWENNSEDLILYFPDQGLILTVTPQLEFPKILRLSVPDPEAASNKNTEETDEQRLLSLFDLIERENNGSLYALTEPIVSDSTGIKQYLKLTVTDSSGQVTSIIDASFITDVQKAVTATVAAIIALFAVFFVTTELCSYKRRGKSPKNAISE